MLIGIGAAIVALIVIVVVVSSGGGGGGIKIPDKDIFSSGAATTLCNQIFGNGAEVNSGTDLNVGGGLYLSHAIVSAGSYPITSKYNADGVTCNYTATNNPQYGLQLVIINSGDATMYYQWVHPKHGVWVEAMAGPYLNTKGQEAETESNSVTSNADSYLSRCGKKVGKIG